MNLAALSLRRPVTVTMLFISMIVIGLIGADRLRLEFLPDIEFPALLVMIPYRNSTPEEVERRIARPVEESLATLSGIERMRSETTGEGSNLFVRFAWGEDLAIKGVEARDRIDAIRDRLPPDLDRVRIQKFDVGSLPALTLRVSGERDLSDAWDLLDRNVKRRLERLPGVSRVELFGVEPRQVRIELHADRVAAHGVDLQRLGAQLQRANFALTAGSFVEAGRRYFVKPEGRFESIEAIRALGIDARGLRLGDIADVVYADPPRTSGRRLDGRLAIGVNVFKETGANLVEVADRALAEVEALGTAPEMRGIALYVSSNTAADVRRALSSLIEAGLIGALLSVLVLYVFLRDAVMTMIVALAVPLSLCMTLGAMYFMGYTLNLLTLMGLMLSVGMLVDNSVVVTESIFRTRAEQPDPRAATLLGVRRVGLAVTLGTLTTAIVFLPNVFGEQNEITTYLSHVAVTICVSLAASLVVAVTLIPLLTTRFVGRMRQGAYWVQRLTDAYARILVWTLHRPGPTALFILLVLASVAIPALAVKVDLFPPDQGSRLQLRYNVNNVYRLDKVEAAVATIEQYLLDHRERFEIESVYSSYDQGRAESTIVLKTDDSRQRDTAEIEADIRAGLPRIAIGEPGFETTRAGLGEQLSVQIFGESSESILAVAREAERVLRAAPGLSDVRLKTEAGDLEVRVRVDREKAQRHGLSSQQIGEVVAGAMRGLSLRPYRTTTGEVDLVLMFRLEDRVDLEALRQLPIVTPAGERVALRALAELTVGEVPGRIQREDRQVALNLEFGTADGTSTEQARQQIERTLSAMQFPPGYGWGYGRAFSSEQKSMRIMLQNMLLAVACIYLVMAALFESVLAPSAILSGILFSFVGVYWFFLATGTELSLMAMIGMLVLMGVVVNNGIVLIDRVNQLRVAGMPREQALIQGSCDRLRPILMTAATTVLGMVPLAIETVAAGGHGAPPYHPMARAVIGGLLFATLVSLLVLPTIYLALEDLGEWGRRVLHRSRAWRSPLISNRGNDDGR